MSRSRGQPAVIKVDMVPLAAIWIVSAVLAASAVVGLAWAVQNRQFDELDRGAQALFEDGDD